MSRKFFYSKIHETLQIDHVSFHLLLATIDFYQLEIFLRIVPNCKQTADKYKQIPTKTKCKQKQTWDQLYAPKYYHPRHRSISNCRK